MRKILCLLMLSATALVAACGDSEVTATPAVTEAVPAEVTTSSEAAANYADTLSDASTATSDALEPVALPDTVATDDTAEPKAIP